MQKKNCNLSSKTQIQVYKKINKEKLKNEIIFNKTRMMNKKKTKKNLH